MQIHLGRTTLVVRFSFLFTVSFLLLFDRDGITFLSLLAAVLHETGHITALLILSDSPVKVTLRGMGFSLHHKPLSFKTELLSLLSGPVFNLFLCVFFRRRTLFSAVNLITGLLNLIPVPFTDGGRILSLIFLRYLHPVTAVRIAKAVGFVFSVPVFALAILVLLNNPYNYTLLVLFVYIISSVLHSSGLD